MDNLNGKIISATKWATITEIIAKLVTPITNMFLARILTPEAFGVVATISMVVSFADMFTDAGFQKYLIQHEFKNEEEKEIYTNVAFWTNLLISLFLWFIIAIFSNNIAIMVGNPGLGYVITIACIQLPLTSFSSIQMAIYRRDFNFKTLFTVRLIGICTPFFVTVPLAFIGLEYWALIIGSIVGLLVNAIMLTIKSKWKPKLQYDFLVLKSMLLFSIWTLIESISIWLTLWIDSFIIGAYLDQYYLGLYKTSTSTVKGIMAIITSSIIPVLFSALSRVQNDQVALKNVYYKLQRSVSYIIFPMGAGIYLYRDLVVKILLGSQWNEASDIVGVWALTTVFAIVFSNFNSELYRAKGRPKISFISQVIHLGFLIPTCIISLKYGFWAFVYSRSLIRLQSVVTGFILMKYCMNFSPYQSIKNIIKPLISTLIMFAIGMIVKQYSSSILYQIICIIICIVVYLGVVSNVAKDDYKYIEKLFINKIKKRKRQIEIG